MGKPWTVLGLGELLWDLLPSGKRLGGAPANFAYHAHALGAEGVVVSCVGADALGAEALSELEALGLRTDGVAVSPDAPTGQVDVELDGAGRPRYRIQKGVAWDALPWQDGYESLAGEADALCFGSLAQRSEPARRTIRRVLGSARPGCLRIFDVNLRQHHHSEAIVKASLEAATVLKLNDEELPVVCRLVGLEARGEDALEALRERYALSCIAYTCGGEGSTLVSPTETHRLHGVPIQVADTVGAGDSFTAALAIGLLSGWSLSRTHERANALASYVCTRHGATPPLPDTFTAP